MASYNKVLLMGNLTRDPEVRYTPKGTALANLGLAVNRVYTTEGGEQKEEVTFIDIEVWGRQAENRRAVPFQGAAGLCGRALEVGQLGGQGVRPEENKLKVVANAFSSLARHAAERSSRIRRRRMRAPARPAGRGARPCRATGAGRRENRNRTGGRGRQHSVLSRPQES